MEIVLGYLAGLLTLINPCVLPVLPIVLGSALQASRAGPLAMAGGMAVSFVAFGMLVATFGYALGISESTLADAGAVVMIGFGLVLLVPRFSAAFSTATAGLAAGADARIARQPRTGAGGQFIGGLLLGAVWSPCIGPTLGAAISLASQGESLGRAFAIMTAFAAGVATLILALGYGLRGVLARNRAAMQALAQWSRPLMGLIFVAVGVFILFRLNHLVDAALLSIMPDWLLSLSVSI